MFLFLEMSPEIILEMIPKMNPEMSPKMIPETSPEKIHPLALVIRSAIRVLVIGSLIWEPCSVSISFVQRHKYSNIHIT